MGTEEVQARVATITVTGWPSANSDWWIACAA